MCSFTENKLIQVLFKCVALQPWDERTVPGKLWKIDIGIAHKKKLQDRRGGEAVHSHQELHAGPMPAPSWADVADICPALSRHRAYTCYWQGVYHACFSPQTQ